MENHGCLDRWALLNIEMDSMAKAHLQQHKDAPLPNLPFEHEKLSIFHRGRKLANLNINHLYTLVRCDDIKAHWKQREEHITGNNYTDDEWDQRWELIDWKCHGRAFRRAPLGTQRWLTKHASGHCGVGRQQLRRTISARKMSS